MLDCVEGREHSADYFSPSDDFNGRLVARVAACPNQHRQEQRHHQVLPDELLVRIQDEGGGGLQDQQPYQPPSTTHRPCSAAGVIPNIFCVPWLA